MNKNLIAKPLPQHIAIIMDGNRRWARKRLLPVKLGHSAGAENLKKIAKYCNKIGIKHLTVWAFSTENWKRSTDEVSALMTIFKKYLKSTLDELHTHNIKIKFLGDITRFSEDLRSLITKVEKETSANNGMILNIAMNYGGRAEILNAIKLLIDDVVTGKTDKNDINEKIFSSKLYTANQPDVDLFIRPSGEIRTSDFLPWQSSYAEYCFPATLWPDFSEKDIDAAINDYFSRSRRFGE